MYIGLHLLSFQKQVRKGCCVKYGVSWRRNGINVMMFHLLFVKTLISK